MKTFQVIDFLKKNAFTVSFYLLTLLVVLVIGPKYQPDSFAHFDMLINRSVLYSLFLNIPHWLFGLKMGYTILLAQFGIYVLCVTYFINSLSKFINLSKLTTSTLHFIFAYLAIFTYQVINNILSESLAYPFLLVVLAISMKYYKLGDIKYIGTLWILCYLLFLTRIQFVIVLPFLCLILIYHYKKIYKSFLAIIFTVGLLSSPFLAKQTETLYYKFVLKENIAYSMTFVHLISAPFFVSDVSDALLFEKPEERDFFIRTKQSLDNKNLNLAYCHNNREDEFDYYQKNFTKICNASIHEENMDYYKSLGISFFDQHRKVSQYTKNIFYPLLKAHFKLWLKIVLKGFKKGLHGSQGILIIGLVMLGSLLLYFHHEKDFALFFLWVIGIKLMLHLFIAISVHSVHRYLFYFDWVIPVFLILLIDKLVLYKNKSYKFKKTHV